MKKIKIYERIGKKDFAENKDIGKDIPIGFWSKNVFENTYLLVIIIDQNCILFVNLIPFGIILVGI